MESLFCRFTTLSYNDWNRFIIHLGTSQVLPEANIFLLAEQIVKEHGKLVEVFDPETDKHIKV